jgi:hypothetical protein
MEQDKTEKKSVLEDRVRILEEVILSEKPKDEHKFKVIL